MILNAGCTAWQSGRQTSDARTYLVKKEESLIMELNSQRVRALAPENDPLKMGMGWTVEDLDKPQILVESTFGDSHPVSAHLYQFVD